MAVNTDKQNMFIGNLGGAPRAGLVLVGEKLRLYKALLKSHMPQAGGKDTYPQCCVGD